MSRLVVINHLTLDDVMQAPGRLLLIHPRLLGSGRRRLFPRRQSPSLTIRVLDAKTTTTRVVIPSYEPA